MAPPEQSDARGIRVWAAIGMSILLVITVLFLSTTFLNVETTLYDPTGSNVAEPPGPSGPAAEEAALPPRLFGYSAGMMLPVIGWSLSLATVALTWVALFTRNRRVQFEIPFWGGLAILCAASRYSWVTHQHVMPWAEAGTFREGWYIWPVPLFSAFGTFVGLLLILWAVSRPFPEPRQR